MVCDGRVYTQTETREKSLIRFVNIKLVMSFNHIAFNSRVLVIRVSNFLCKTHMTHLWKGTIISKLEYAEPPVVRCYAKFYNLCFKCFDVTKKQILRFIAIANDKKCYSFAALVEINVLWWSMANMY